MGNPIEDPLEIILPADIRAAGRTIHVAPGKMSTFRLMHDPFDTKRDRWFQQGGGMPAVTDGNEVKALIRGEETFADMVTELRTATRPDPARRGSAFFYAAGWDLNGGSYFSTPLKSGDPSSTLDTLFKAASAAGVEIRALMWANGPFSPFGTPSTVFAIGAINKLPTGRGILDWKTAVLFTLPQPASDQVFHIGAHHQKIVIVRASGRISAYIGGIDLELKRLDIPSNPDKIGWQDIHCRIRGPAADDVLKTFSQRWDDYLNSPNNDVNHDTIRPKFPNGVNDPSKNGLSASQLSRSSIVDAEPHRQSVQICRTFHSKLYDRIPPGNRAGEKSIRTMVLNAIAQAEQFIYLEDQYAFSMDISNALKKVIANPKFRWLIILMPVDGAVNGELGFQASHRRAEFIENLRNAPGGEKVKAFTRTNRFVHSKTYIIDDKFAVIGSANCNRRGMEHDTEISAGIFDKASDKAEVLHFARRLRMRLWATHLNFSAQTTEPNSPVNSQDEYAEMADGVASAVHWFKRPASARVAEYPVDNNLKLAIQALIDEEKKYIAEINKLTIPIPNIPGGFGPFIPALPVPNAIKALAILAVQTFFARLTKDKAGVDRAWNELFDPGDP